MAVAGAATSIIAQNNQRQAEKGYQNKLQQANAVQMEENRSIATTSYLDQSAQLNNRLAQERQAAATANENDTTKRVQAEGQVGAAAAESGTSGLALDSLYQDFHRQEGMFRANNDTNLLFEQQQTATQISGDRLQARSRMQQIQPYIQSPIAPVDYVGAVLGSAGTGVSAWGNHSNAQSVATSKVGGGGGGGGGGGFNPLSMPAFE